MNKPYRPLVFVAVAAVIFSCITSRKKELSDLAMNLALRDDLIEAQEAVVWTLSSSGQVSTYWIKNDVTGVLVTASRPDLVILLKDALWRLENNQEDKDYNFLELQDLVSGDVMRIPLDEEALALADRDAGADEDAGLPPASTQKDKCPTYKAQGRPLPLVSVGPFLFIKYEEQTYNCEDERVLSETRFIAVDLNTGEEADLLTEKEKKALFDRDEVKSLEKEGEVTLAGMVPSYNPTFGLSFVYVFSSVLSAPSKDGSTHCLVNSLEISDNKIPQKLGDFYLAPELVQAFGASLPDEVLGGFWALGGSSELIEKQLTAFVDQKEPEAAEAPL